MSDDYKPVLRPGSDPIVFFQVPGATEAGETAKGHIMAAAISRALNDGDLVVMGANSLLPLAAARLAQLTHAPNLSIITGASGGVNTLVEPLAPSSGDYANLVAECVLQFQEVLMLQMSGHAQVFFAGGLQIDTHGNCNLAFVGDIEKPTLRGPGSAGVPWSQHSTRTILYTTSHTRRVFVPQVDFVSCPGWNAAEGTSRVNGPQLVVTPLALMDFSDAGDMRLVSLHPGVSLDQVRDNTGFDLLLPAGDLPTTPEPTPLELQLLRAMDPDALLTVVV
ncbi:MAG: CoA synthetase [Chloroflexota bacterium]|nr:CoA synthetase [Chloroflexota bacterium]MDQ5864548.1 CoA synthetase [Chloroflexota bacterium]